MNITVNCSFKITGWDETEIHHIEDERKFVQASITKSYQGDLEGEAQLEYLMIYTSDTSAQVLGFERIIGRIMDRSGSFILQHLGEYDRDQVKIGLSVVKGSGTGELAGLEGSGLFEAGHAEEYPISFKFTL